MISVTCQDGTPVVYNGENPAIDGELDKRSTPNYWLDVDGKWFEVKKNQRAPWMEIALQEAKKAKGVDEEFSPMYKMAKGYLEFVGNSYEPTDGVYGPWCASFMNWCINESGYKYAKSASSLAPIHKDLKKYYKKIEKPIYGCIVVYKHKSDWKGHTGFLYGMNSNEKYLLLGGNQTDTIKLSEYGEYTSKSKKKKLYGFYVPADYKVTNADYLTDEDKDLNLNKENKKIGVLNTKNSGKTT
ncbi:MAG: TIGR02594 family protein [Flavobacteriaceae bacterium]|nr:TIGR02594 family protein [Flavobacteriaceae bacterium]